MANTSDRIKEALELRGLKQADLVEMTGINKGALSSYIYGRYKPKQNNTYLIAKALDVNEAWLMGADVPMERRPSDIGWTNSPNLPPFPNIFPIAKKTFPVLSAVACGEPILMQDGIELYVEASTNIKADYVLKAKGDSMTGAGIFGTFISSSGSLENCWGNL